LTRTGPGYTPGVDEHDAFGDLLAQLADGAQWKVMSGVGRQKFAERLTREIGDLELRRRQAIVMCLFALLAGDMQADDLAGFVQGRDMRDDAAVEALIAWLRENYDPGG
jgi:hypothetical protein